MNYDFEKQTTFAFLVCELLHETLFCQFIISDSQTQKDSLHLTGSHEQLSADFIANELSAQNAEEKERPSARKKEEES